MDLIDCFDLGAGKILTKTLREPYRLGRERKI